MIEVFPYAQGSDEWLALRKTRIGSSDAACVMGLDQFGKTWIDLYNEKKGLSDPRYVNDAMRKGTALEPYARRWYEMNSGILLWPKVLTNTDFPWAMTSTDGLSMGNDHLIEIKAGGPKLHEMAARGIIPVHYGCQLQHHMMVAGLGHAMFISYRCIISNGHVEDEDGIIIDVPRDDAFIEKMICKQKEFYTYMEGHEPPPLSEGDHIKLEADHFQQVRIGRWFSVANDLKNMTKLEKELRSEISDCGDDGNVEWVDDTGKPILRMTRVAREGNVDWKKLCAEKGITDEEIAKYRKEAIGFYKFSEP